MRGRKVFHSQGREGDKKREMLFLLGLRWESPRGEKAQKSNGSRSELILRNALKGNSFSGGSKPLKRRYKAVVVL